MNVWYTGGAKVSVVGCRQGTQIKQGETYRAGYYFGPRPDPVGNGRHDLV